MKIVISGSHGFIGSNLIKAIGARHDVVGIERNDFYNESFVRSACRDADVFVHLAGISSIAGCEANIAEAINVNVGLAAYLSEIYYRENPKGHFIFASTGQVYDDSAAPPYSENSPVRPGSLYSRTKLAAEGALTAIAESHNGQLTVLRFFNISHKSQSPSFFVPSIYKQISESSDKHVTVVVGNIDIERDLSSIQSVVGKIVKCVEDDKKYGIRTLNICSGVPLKLRSVILAMASYLGKNVEIVVDAAKVRKGESLRHFGKTEMMDVLDPAKALAKFIEEFTRDT